MPLTNLFDRLVTRPASKRRPSTIRRSGKHGSHFHRRRAILETLEDRRVLASFLVITGGDAGTGTCDATSCTLRDAVLAANAMDDADTIGFDDAVRGTITLDPGNASLQVTGPVTVVGPGAADLTVEAGTDVINQFRVFDITDTAGDVTLTGLTVSGGSVPDEGGGIRFQSNGLLSIQNSVLSGNSANNGGAIYSEFGNLEITSSTITGNTATAGAGGGIQNNYGDTTLTSSFLTDNESGESGGGLFSPYDGNVSISGTEITGNRVVGAGYHGAGLYTGGGALTITGSTITGNTSAGDGGGLYNIDGVTSILNSTVSNNQAEYSGAGIFNYGGSLSITNTSISDNSALYGDGGGISNGIASLTLTRSTISGNGSVDDGGGVSNASGQVTAKSTLFFDNTSGADGGGLATLTGPVTLTNSTFSENSANVRGGGVQSDSAPVRAVNSTFTLNNASVEGGGIGLNANNDGETLLIHNSILAGNTSPNGPDFIAPALISNLEVAFSVIGDNDATTLTAGSPDGNGNFVGTTLSPADPQLQPLATNGGPTQTHALLSSSIAVDSGDNTLALDFGADGAPGGGDDTALISDQRSGLFERIADSGGGLTTDMGAFELQPATPVLIVDTADDVDNGNFAPGDRSLRELLGLANSNPGLDTILFAPSFPSMITLDPANGPLVISDQVNIDGPGADLLTLRKDPAQEFRLINVTNTAGDVRLRGLSLSGGNAGLQNGGAILSNTTGTLSIVQSALTSNVAASGGAIAATDGAVSVAASTISNNTATADGGGLALTADASAVLLLNSTLSSNEADEGGGLYSENASISITNSTVTLNSATTDGGGIGLLADDNGESLSIENSIVAGNTAVISGPDFLAPMDAADLDVDFSLIGDNLGTTLPESTLNNGQPEADADGNLIGGGLNPIIDPMLGPLSDNGGPTMTHRPMDGSLAIGAGDATLLPTDEFDLDRDNVLFEILPVDQRGGTRTINALEMGAMELPPPAPLTWEDPGDIVFNTPLGMDQLNASSTIPGSFEYTPASGATLNAGDDQLLTVVFTPADLLAFRPSTATVMIDVLKADPVITWDDPAAITFGTELSATELDASADVGGSFVYDPMIGAMLDAGTQMLSTTFTPTDTANYNVVSANATLVVNPADPGLMWSDPAGITFGTALDDTQLNATANQPGTFVYDPPATTVLNAGDGQELKVTFTPDSSNFSVVMATVTIDVAKADPVITWATPDPIPVGTPLSDTQLNASSGGLPGTFVYDPPATTILSAGDGQELSVTFMPTDSNNYNNATQMVLIDVTQGLDYGDAPSIYPVLLADDGARHAPSSLTLGSSVDIDDDGQPSDNADADGADEDGVLVIAPAVSISDASTTASFLVESSEAGLLDAWIDFNGNGSWNDAGERIIGNLALTAGLNVVPYALPPGASIGNTAARFRLSTSGVSAPTGEASDGEVEDYIVSILDGSTTPDVSIDLPGNAAVIELDNGNLAVTDGSSDLFNVPASSLGTVTIQGGSDDDTVTLDLDGSADAGLGIDGLGGSNTLVLLGSTLDLTDGGVVDAQNFQTVDLTAAGSNIVTIDAPTVAALSPTANTLSVSADEFDAIVFADATDWRMVDPRVDDGEFIRIASNQVTGEVVEVSSPLDWQNPIDPSDVNNSGDVTAGDALIIINELGRRAFSDRTTQDLFDASGVGEFPGTYYDQNGDGKNTSLDALRVINRLAVIFNSTGTGGESELVLPPSLQSLVTEIAQQDPGVAEDDAEISRMIDKLVDASGMSESATGGSSAGSSMQTDSNDGTSWSRSVDELLSDFGDLA